MRPGQPDLTPEAQSDCGELYGPEVEACAALAGLRDQLEPSLGPEAGVPPSVSA